MTTWCLESSSKFLSIIPVTAETQYNEVCGRAKTLRLIVEKKELRWEFSSTWHWNIFFSRSYFSKMKRKYIPDCIKENNWVIYYKGEIEWVTEVSLFLCQTIVGLAQALNHNAGKYEFSSSFERSGLYGGRVKNKLRSLHDLGWSI